MKYDCREQVDKEMEKINGELVVYEGNPFRACVFDHDSKLVDSFHVATFNNKGVETYCPDFDRPIKRRKK